MQAMATPSQDFRCKECHQHGAPHTVRKNLCEPCGKRKQVDYARKYRERLANTDRKVICKGCGTEFTTKGRGKTWRCHECTLARQRELAAKDRERHAKYSRNYRAKMGDAYREKMVKRRADTLASMTEEQVIDFRRAEAEKSKLLNAKCRDQVFNAYGGYKCVCCGETERLFLSIDHIDNNGCDMRREGVHSRGGSAFYQWLRKSGFPSGFQVLCMNCNTGKHRNGGVCPHQSKA